jgi:hypothetical protein
MQANRKANVDEKITVVPSQNLDPKRLMDMNSERNVKCMERYPRNMITISSGSAF